MGLFSAIGRRYRSFKRYNQILRVFVKYGFEDLVAQMIASGSFRWLRRFIPRTTRKRAKLHTKWEKMRIVCEELGPTFVKFGQILSNRSDLLPVELITEFAKLQDNVPPFSGEEAKRVLETELKKSTDVLFAKFDLEPFASASMAQVHKAILNNGDRLAIKIQRPNIEAVIIEDIRVMYTIAGILERRFPSVKAFDPIGLVRNFEESILKELDFIHESINAQRFYHNLVNDPKAVGTTCPKIYQDLTTKRVLTMEFVKGTKISNYEQFLVDGHDRIRIAERLATSYIKQVFEYGFFHADLHGGNFFYQPNGKIGLIDYGLMGTLGKKSRLSFVAILYALISNDFENLVYEFLDVAEFEDIPDVDNLIKDVRDSLSPFIGLTVQQTDFTLVLKTLSDTLRTHRIYLPRDWFIVFRALMTLDGVGKSLDMDIDLFNLFTKDIGEIVKNNFKKEELLEDPGWAARDIISSSRVIPRHLRWFLKEWSKNGYAFEVIHKGHEKQLNSLSYSLIFLGNSILSGIVFISGVFLIRNETISSLSSIPTISWLFWGISIVIILNSWRIVRRG